MKNVACRVLAVVTVFVMMIPMMAVAVEMEDVSPDDWFYRYVTHGLRFGLIEGVSDEGFVFEPNRSVTRAEFVTMLGRLHEYGNEVIGVPGVGAFYERYLAWAVEMGIMHGDENGDLMPQAFITREQMAVVVYRYIEVFGLWGCFRGNFVINEADFNDFENISQWAWRQIMRLRERILISGPPGFFRPQEAATRAEVLALLVRVCSAIYDLKHPIL